MRRDWKVKQKSTERAPICDAMKGGRSGGWLETGKRGKSPLNTSMPPTFLASTRLVVLSESVTHELLTEEKMLLLDFM